MKVVFHNCIFERVGNKQLKDRTRIPINELKDGTSFCYCAYVLRISGYSEFDHLYNNIFPWFMTMWKRQILARAIRIQKEIGSNHAFFRDN